MIIPTFITRIKNQFAIGSSVAVWPNRTQRGFTLIELLVVIAIIGILASVVLASLNSAREKGRVASAQQQLSEIRKAMLLLHADTGVYPSNISGVTDICLYLGSGTSNEIAADDPNAGLNSNGRGWTGWAGPYLAVPLDPWGTPYYFDSDYDCTGNPVGCDGFVAGGQDDSVIVSCGPNGSTANNACAYDSDNVVLYLCDNGN